jgi:hypothetical protein
MLAEAAPDAFLSAVEADLMSNNPATAAFLIEDKSPIFGAAYHTNLLWALESLARSSDYLARAALVLAKLARLDPPRGRYANRPKVSLHNIFCLWMPQTLAQLVARLTVLDLVRKSEPDIGWRLLRDLLPSSQNTISPAAQPTWRDFSAEGSEEITNPLLAKSVEAIADRLLQDVVLVPCRWPSLIASLPQMPPNRRQDAISQLDAMSYALDGATGAAVRVALRKLLYKHRRFAKAA